MSEKEGNQEKESFQPNEFSRILLSGIFGLALLTAWGVDTILQPQLIKEYLDPNIFLNPELEHLLESVFNHVGDASVGLFLFGFLLIGEIVMQECKFDEKGEKRKFIEIVQKMTPFILTTIATISIPIAEFSNVLGVADLADVPAGLFGIIAGTLCFEEIRKWVKKQKRGVYAERKIRKSE